MNNKISSTRRAEAFKILKDLLTRLPGITADVFYIALRDAGFSVDECFRSVGGVFRSAAASGIMEKTFFAQPSRRNHGNRQQLWISRICSKEDTDEINKWRDRGFLIDLDKIQLYKSLASVKTIYKRGKFANIYK